MAHILPSRDLPSRDLLAWCEHGTPLGHSCQFCQLTAPFRPPPPGWTCPSCRHSYAPWVPECHHCPVETAP